MPVRICEPATSAAAAPNFNLNQATNLEEKPMLRSVLQKLTVTSLGATALILCCAGSLPAQNPISANQPPKPATVPQPVRENRPRFIKAFVVDDRLSALRRDADLKSPVLRRLRLGRAVYVIEGRGAKAQQPGFYRVAETRRTRGWIHQAAIAIPGRTGDDARVIGLIEERLSEKETASGIFERLLLGKLFMEKFASSKLTPKAMLLFGEDAERAAALLSRSAHRQAKRLDDGQTGVSLRDFYLSDASLDRYSRLGVHFDYLEKSAEYLYDGQIHRQLLQRYPKSEQAAQARRQLQINLQKSTQK
jgi:hypothetical protein